MSRDVTKSSPYLAHSGRLGDVIGAIQVLGSFPWHAIKEEHWETHFGTAASSPDGKWGTVFREHPEFFRIERNGDVALRWRFASERTFDPRKGIDYTPDRRDSELTQEEKDRLHRRPLSADQINALFKVAIELHARALAQAQDVRWKLQAFISFVVGLMGAGIGVIASLLKP